MALTSNVLEPNSGYNVWTSNGALHIFNKRSNNDLKGSDSIYPFEKELDEIYKKGALEFDFNKRKDFCIRCIIRIIKDYPEYESLISNIEVLKEYYDEVKKYYCV